MKKRRSSTIYLKTKSKRMYWKRVTALAMSMALMASGMTPISNVQAAEEEHVNTENKQYIVYIDLPDVDGSYDAVVEDGKDIVDVKNAENTLQQIQDSEELLAHDADGQEIANTDNAIVYETDLTAQELEVLLQSEAEIYVEENIELFGAQSNMGEDEKDETNRQETEWNISMIHGDVDTPLESGAVKIAVMDSGIELLAGIPVQGMINLVKSEQDIAYYMNDMTGHGTAVASIISDIDENAELYSVKIMDKDNRATLSSVVEGIYWCIDHDIDIINMSFGTDVQSQILHKAIQDAADAGILIVSSAGNSGIAGVEYPAAFDEVIAVGAVDTLAQKTEESAVGEEVELAAPGEQILADSMLGLLTVVSGTSMAAPHVTGAAALLWQKDKTKSADFIRGLLAESANNLGDENFYGHGLVDVQFALDHYEQYADAYGKLLATAEYSGSTQLLSEDNNNPVETHEEVDYVEGRWNSSGHKSLVDLANSDCDGILQGNEVNVFKSGMVYPDQAFPVAADTNNRNWHGGFKVNYVANYRFATRMAKYAGDTSQYQKSKGQSTDCYNQMKAQVSSTSVGGSTYASILSNVNGTSYSSLSAANQKKWRRLFLYGMAAHIVSDTFCHSAYVIQNGQYVYLYNTGLDDEPTYYPNRYADAREAVSMVLGNYSSTVMGSEVDFSPAVEYWGISRGYYLRNILSYASAAAVDYTDSELQQMFGAINYAP